MTPARVIRLLLLTALLLGLGTGAALLLPLLTEKQVVIQVDSRRIEVGTRAESVARLLGDLDIRLAPGDFSEPPPASALQDGQHVRVLRARSVTLTVDGFARVFRTHQTRPAGILAAFGLQPGPQDELRVDGQRVTLAQLADWPTPASEIMLNRARRLTLIEDGRAREILATAPTVGEALQAAGVTLYLADELRPGPRAPLQAGMTVALRRARPFTIVADGAVIATRARSERIGAALAEAGVPLTGLDYSLPAADQQLLPGLHVRVIRVREELAFEDTALPHETRSQLDYGLELDRRRLLQAGHDGLMRQPWRLRYENDVLISREEAGEESLLRAPQAEIIGIGAKIVLRTVQTPAGPREYWRRLSMWATSYHPGSAGGSTITATGATLRRGIVASNPRVIPYGAQVYVPGYGIGSMEDTAAAWYVQQRPMFIDLGYSDTDYRPWARQVDVYLLAPAPPPDRIRYTLPG